MLSPSTIRDMAREIVYADLNVPGYSSSSRPSPSSEHINSSVHLHLHKVTVGILGVGSIILVSAVIGLSILRFQSLSWKEQTREALNATDCKCDSVAHPVDCRSRIKQFMCGSPSSRSSEGSECILCPVNWLKHRGKCYWISENIRNWQNSCNDCLTNNSQILVIQDENEMAFIRNITPQSNLVWIGLSVSTPEKKWIWANGSHFDEKLFKIEGPPNKNSCVAIRRNYIQSETCNGQYRFICKKNGFEV